MANNDDASNLSIKWLSNDRSFSELQVKTITCSHTWTIKNFVYCPQKFGECLLSPKFFIEHDIKLKWHMQLYPKGKTEKVGEFISVFLFLTRNSYTKPVFVKFGFSFLNSNKILVKKLTGQMLFDNVSGHGFNKFVERNILLSKLLPDDQLTIHCEIITSLESSYVSNPETPFGVQTKELPLAKNLGLLLKSEIFSDVTLKVQDKKFLAHKAILAANSLVFSAMFDCDMKEKHGNLVDIKDLNSESIGTMLRFMYTAEKPVLSFEKAKDVLAASDKYAIDSLKSFCEDYLASKLTANTAADLLYLADLHNAEDLKRLSLNFIRDHASKILITSSWKALSERQPRLLLEAFENLVLRENQ